jgi:hypothetical protein
LVVLTSEEEVFDGFYSSIRLAKPDGVTNESTIPPTSFDAKPIAKAPNGLSSNSDAASFIMTALTCSFMFCRKTGKSMFSDNCSESCSSMPDLADND